MSKTAHNRIQSRELHSTMRTSPRKTPFNSTSVRSQILCRPLVATSTTYTAVWSYLLSVFLTYEGDVALLTWPVFYHLIVLCNTRSTFVLLFTSSCVSVPLLTRERSRASVPQELQHHAAHRWHYFMKICNLDQPKIA